MEPCIVHFLCLTLWLLVCSLSLSLSLSLFLSLSLSPPGINDQMAKGMFFWAAIMGLAVVYAKSAEGSLGSWTLVPP